MFKKVLIANRGEIAVRIIRACKEMEFQPWPCIQKQTKMHFVKLADESFCIGKTSSKRKLLKYSNLLTVAQVTKADAVHPGYGF
ncbi:hypothetical protein F6Y02_43665 [Bacillus megaterium]|nr:hypothetical protein [Priestia megaterium]